MRASAVKSHARETPKGEVPGDSTLPLLLMRGYSFRKILYPAHDRVLSPQQTVASAISLQRPEKFCLIKKSALR